MKTVSLKDIAYLIPANCYYRNEDPSTQVLYIDSDTTWNDPVDLDAIGTKEGFDEIYPFVLINGNLTASQIFNEETDGSTGLIVLGDLSAANIVVGGQVLYVSGNLSISEVYWGDYNHGELFVEGEIKAACFINTDYGIQYDRFRNGERMHIGNLLWDEQDDDYDVAVLDKILRPEFILDEPLGGDDEVYSWKDWIDTDALFEALRENKPLGHGNTESDQNSNQPTYLFEGEHISAQNLKKFAEPQFYSFREAVRSKDYEMEYWDGNVYKRIYTIPSQPLATSVYFQNDEKYACMVYFGKDESQEDDIAYDLSISYCPDLNKDEWLTLDKQAPEKYANFLTKQWKSFLHEMSEMVWLQQQYDTYISIEKFDAIMALPIVQRLGKRYYDDSADSVIFFRGIEWQFRNAGADKEDVDPRITFAKRVGEDEDGEDLFELIHLQKETDEDGKDTLMLYFQEDDGYESDLYELSIVERSKFKEAIHYFKLLDQHIRERIEK